MRYNDEDRKTWLQKIYSEAQDSAQHHDQLMWAVVAIIIAGILALTGQVSSELIKNEKVKDPFTFLVLWSAVFLLSYVTLLFAAGYRNIRHNKYRILQNIEVKLVRARVMEWGNAQHLVLDGFTDLKNRLGRNQLRSEDKTIYERDFRQYKKLGWRLLRLLILIANFLWVFLSTKSLPQYLSDLGFSSLLILDVYIAVIFLEFILVRHADLVYKNINV
jgi:hypothetical protein